MLSVSILEKEVIALTEEKPPESFLRRKLPGVLSTDTTEVVNGREI
jgi:hypothetical protein